MKRRHLGLSAVLILVLSLVIPAISCTTAQTDQAVPEKQQDTEQAEFQLSPITVTPKWLFVGDNASVAATVTNMGTADGTYKAEFTIDGKKVDEKEIQLAQGQRAEVSFPLTSIKASATRVAIGDSNVLINSAAVFPYHIQYDHYGEIYISKSGEEKINPGWGDIMYEPYGQMVKFTVPAKPFQITGISLMCRASMLNKSDKERHFTINIWDNKRTRTWTGDFPWTLFGGIEQPVTLDVPDIHVDDDFYVELVSHSPYKQSVEGSYKFMGEDVFLSLIYHINDYITRSTRSNQGQPMPQKQLSGIYKEFVIRVEGEGGPTKVLYYDDAESDIYNATADFSFINAFVATSYPFDLRLIQLHGYRDIKDAGDHNITLKVIDKVTMQPIWQKIISWAEIPYSGTKLGTWVDIDTGGLICNHDFFIELTTNNSADAHVWLGCDTSAINRSSDMSVGGNIISWREWTDTSGTEIKRYTRDNTKWMIRVAGIAK